MDFTLKTFTRFIETIQKQGYSFQTFHDFIENPVDKVVVMRHDVDRLPGNALKVAEIEAGMGVGGSYYFRAGKESFDPEIVQAIEEMGHEIGYHYEDLARVIRNLGVRIPGKKSARFRTPAPRPGAPEVEFFHEIAIEEFHYNLEKFREIVDVKTICMHGSPTSKVDSRDLWKVYDYRAFGIIGEPYFDINFSKVLYLTDTGRRWDGERYNIRDRVTKNEMGTDNGGQGTSQNSGRPSETGPLKPDLFSERPPVPGNPKPVLTHSYKTTFDIINALERDELPGQIMINTHPHRWFNFGSGWIKELLFQNLKNIIKSLIVARKKV